MDLELLDEKALEEQLAHVNSLIEKLEILTKELDEMRELLKKIS